MGNMIDVLTDQMDNIASSAVESAPFDKSTSGRILAVLDGNRYTVKMSDGTEKSVLSLTSDSFLVNDVVIISSIQNDAKNSYIIGKPGVAKISASGDNNMTQEVYDTNNNGIVDNAEKVNGHTVLSDVPSEAVFTDTTYTDATTSIHGLMSSTDKIKLDGIASGAEKNVNADFDATSGDAQILNLPSTFTPSAHTHTKSDITDFPTIPDQLSDLLDDTSHRLVTDTEKSTWDSKQSALSGDITGHYHAADRNRANHTGTQTASTISDFSSSVLSAAPAETVTSIGSLVYGATAKTSPIDTDVVPIMDSADSNKIKKFSWAYVKSVLSTYFGSIFAAISHTHTTSQITDMPTSLPANGGNAATVNNHTVNKDVPSDALFTDTTYVDVTTSVHGLMSSSDKTKLNGIATGANNYSLPVATSDILGGIKSGTDITVDSSGNVSVADNSHNHTISNVTGLQTALDAKLATSLLGTNSGVAQLGSDGKVPSSQLPSYVDDVLEYSGYANFPPTGETGKIYVDTTTNLTYRWSGSIYTEISPSLALGETSSTAYAGDKGKAVTDALASHKNSTSNPHSVTASQVGLGAFETTATNIKMNGTQGVGVLSTVARADHVHPVDTSRAPASHTHTISSIADLTATAAELNVLDGITASTTELNYVDGVTSNVQTQLNTKAPIDSPTFTGTVTAPTFSGYLSGNAASASKSGLLFGTDTRGVNSAPSEYMSGGSLYVTSISSKTEFKSISALGITSLTGIYCYLITHMPWSDSSGGYPIQIAYGDGCPCWRVGVSNTTWGGWNVANSGGDADKLDGNDASAFALASHTHTVANVGGLQTALDSKVDDSQVLTNVPINAVFTDTVYTHPASHPPSIITQDSSNRFVTDAEKSTWSAKEPAITKNTAFNVNFDTVATNIKMNGPQSVGSLSTAARADHVHPTDTSRAASSHTHTENDITNLTTDLAAKASLASPAFTGTPTAPTATSGTNTTQLATTAFVQSALSAGGYGDMLKSVYDTDGDGVIDNAEKVSGFTVAKSVPANAVFTDTTYSVATTSTNGLMSSTDKTKLDGLPKITVNSSSPSSPSSGDIWFAVV